MKITLDETEQYTLQWLADRGYDGSFLEEATLITDNDDGSVTYEIDNNGCCAVSEYVDSDPDAFLACCGSQSLADKLISVINKAV